ncbi:MAG: lysylphosphatidylglycerol synthase domain-containing protein [Chloroflexi bacterium]|nr:lysylphosphatidylglycerol synthase domain-containing protein [Chloroflexota bacterium]
MNLKKLRRNLMMGILLRLSDGLAMLLLSSVGAVAFQLGLEVLAAILALATLVGSLSMLPGGLGAAEGSVAVLLVSTVGLASDLAVAATLLIRLCTLWFGVSVGLVALGLLLRRTEIGAEAA